MRSLIINACIISNVCFISMIIVKAIEKAASLGIAPDAMYCMELLDNTGIVLVPGNI